MELISEILSPDQIGREHRERMFQILAEVFDNTRRHVFEWDLRDKNLVILLFDPTTSALVGFSTLKFFEHCFCGSKVRVVFSGDTVIRPKYWGSLELPLTWGAFMMDYWEAEPQTPLYWLLISKGIRTFKYLPTFFNNYYPEVSPLYTRELVSDLGATMFPGHFDESAGVVLPTEDSYFLSPPLADITRAAEGRKHTKLFLAKNPNYKAGSELMCLAEFSPSNLKPFFLREINYRRERIKLEPPIRKVAQ